MAYHHAAVAVAETRDRRGARAPRAAAARAGGARRLAPRAAGRAGAVPAEPARRRRRRHAVGRLAPARAARAGAGGAAGPAAARRADEPPRHRRHHLARGLPRRLSRRGRVRHARPRVPPAPRHAHRRARPRAPDVVAGRLRHVPAQEGRVAGERGGAAGEVRQEARGRGGLAAAGHQGAADAQRGPRPRAGGDARRAGRAPRAAGHGAPAGRGSPTRRAGWCSRRRDVAKSFDGVPVVSSASRRAIMRGDRIGLIGPNGAGKTTLLRLLLGELAPDAGEVRTGANVQVAYYDQQREQLDPERPSSTRSATATAPSPSTAGPRHVNGYLADFLFPPERARSPVKALSGGERNRLLLARLFTRPANVLVLDEPTNDLDLETLELLEAQLVEFPGTLLLVSHDRAFLDNAVTSTLVFEGGGRVQEYVGGYEDWLRQRDAAGTRPPLAEAPRSRARASGRKRRRDGSRRTARARRAQEAHLQRAAGVRRASRPHRGARSRGPPAQRRDRGPGVLQGRRRRDRAGPRPRRGGPARARRGLRPLDRPRAVIGLTTAGSARV